MIVLLHGFTGSPASFDPVTEGTSALSPPTRGCGDRGSADQSTGAVSPPARGRGRGRADRCAPIRPLLTGHGPDPVLADSWDAEIDRLTAQLRQQRITDTHLVGYSLGGRIAFGLLARAPELFARATLIGAHPGLRNADARRQRRAQDDRWIALLERDGLDAFIAEWEALSLWSTQPPALVEALRAIRRTHRAEGLAHALRVLGLGAMPPVDPRAIQTPVELVVGAHDDKHRALAASFAPQIDAIVHVVPNAGHNVLAERPDAVRSILERA